MLAELTHDRRIATGALAHRSAALRCVVNLDRAEGGHGPLSGLDYLAKDLLDLPGRAPSCGLATNDATPPLRKAAVLAALDDAGAARLGFAEMTALACEPSGANHGRQRPLNPWNPARICGGSSSGSGVAVSAGLVDFAVGSDTAGSLRIPAQCCGVSAWKPTPGVVPTDGAMALAPSLDVLGFLARDAATLRRVAGLFASGAGKKGIRRIALADDLLAHADPAIAAACRALAAAIAETGLAIVPTLLAPLLAECDGAVLDLLQAETALEHGWRLARGGLDAMLETRLRKGLSITPERVAEAGAQLSSIARALPLFLTHDAILLPAMPITTPEIPACEPGSANFSGRTLYALSAYTRFVNGLGLPAVGLPCGFDRQAMPIAAQLVGPPGSDLALLDLAADIQRDTDWHGREPTALAAILEDAR